jgi:hypothetical protein
VDGIFESVNKLSEHQIGKYHKHERIYHIVADQETIERIDKLLQAMQWCNNGSSREISIYHDGDGANRLEIKSVKSDMDFPFVKITKDEIQALDTDKLNL